MQHLLKKAQSFFRQGLQCLDEAVPGKLFAQILTGNESLQETLENLLQSEISLVQPRNEHQVAGSAPEKVVKIKLKDIQL